MAWHRGVNPVLAFANHECFAPSRTRLHPCFRKCATRACRFMPYATRLICNRSTCRRVPWSCLGLMSASSRRAVFKLARAIRRLRSCALTPGISGTYPTYHLPWRSKIAVTVSRRGVASRRRLLRAFGLLPEDPARTRLICELPCRTPPRGSRKTGAGAGFTRTCLVVQR